MKIPIKPTQIFQAGKGLQTATHVEVRVVQIELGVKARGAYELQQEDLTDPKHPRYVSLTTGQQDLTPEQYAAWGTDDNYFARTIVQNAGLIPA